jgi:hypothetical protein
MQKSRSFARDFDFAAVANVQQPLLGRSVPALILSSIYPMTSS